LLATIVLAAALLATVALRLFSLPAAFALTGFATGLAGLAHVVTILNHELATQAIFRVSILWHKELLSPRPWPELAYGVENASVRFQRVAGHALSLYVAQRHRGQFAAKGWGRPQGPLIECCSVRRFGAGKKTKTNVQLPTFNIEQQTERTGFTSMFDVGSWTFDVR
jgi:hypothetical protein